MCDTWRNLASSSSYSVSVCIATSYGLMHYANSRFNCCLLGPATVATCLGMRIFAVSLLTEFGRQLTVG